MATLTSNQLERFHRQGYLVVDNVLDPVQDIAPVWSAYHQVLDSIASDLCHAGRISSTHEGLAFEQRLLMITQESATELTRMFDISLPEGPIEATTPIQVGRYVFDVLTHPGLLDVVEAVLGAEIMVHPLQRVRMKLPRGALDGHEDFTALTAPTPWHQDNGVLLDEADNTDLLTVWVPLNEASADNGALEVYPGSQTSELLQHCPSDTEGPTIPASLLPHGGPVPVPMLPGSVLLLHRRVVHRSRPNITNDNVRISWDLRYQPLGQPTGRPQFPGFVARSRANPGQVLTDPDTWADSWYDTRRMLAGVADAGPYFRWGDAPIC